MRLIYFGLIFLIFRVSQCYVTDGRYSVTLNYGEIPGLGLKRSRDAEKPFLLKFPRIQYGADDLYLDVYTDGHTDSNASPVAIIVGEPDIAELCETSRDEDFGGIIFIHIKDVGQMNDVATCHREASSECEGDRLQQALTWVQRNAVKFGGDRSRVTLFGYGPDASVVVSRACNRKEYQHLFQRAVVEFGEENFIHTERLLYSVAQELSIDPPPRHLLVGYDGTTSDENSVTSIVDFVESFANSGSKVTLFNRRNDVSRAATYTKSLLFKLELRFCKNVAISSDVFPPLNLAAWRDGVQVLELDSDAKWEVMTKKNLFELSNMRDTDDFPVIMTTLGELSGRHLHYGSYEADAFYHIPFASSTKRFEYSEMVQPWTGLLDARYPVRYKDCPQHVIMNFGHEDCTNLHVFVPKTFNQTVSSGARLPVMVFMHGGSYAVGTAGGFKIPGPFANSLYDGTVIADFANVVVVSVNYRLAALGFLNDGDPNNGLLDGNYGARDMVVALEWVQKHITEFGGDPDLVTLFGESAGSSGTGLLSLSPMTNGLIHRYIQESGSPLSFFAVDFNPSVLSTGVFTEMGCRSDNFTAVKECLMKRGEFDFIGLKFPPAFVPWRPTIDGVFLTEDPAITTSRPSTLPLLSGCNYDELYVIAAAIIPRLVTDRPLTQADWEAIKAGLDEVLLKYPDRQQYISDIILHSSLDWVMDFTTEAAKKVLIRASSDYVFAAPAFRQALMRSEIPDSASTYMYSFQMKSKLRIHRPWATNSHAFELPYVFGEGLRRTERDFLYNATADKLSRQMITYWTNFAKTGNPNEPLKQEIEEIVWDEYNNNTKPYMALNFRMTPDNLKYDYRAYELELWDVLIPLLLQLDDDACFGRRNHRLTRKESISRTRPRPKSNEVFQAPGVEQRTSVSIKADICDLSEKYVHNTTTGCVRGYHSEYEGNGVEMYLGIPYAEPPTGDLRFSPTKEAQSWGEGILDASFYMPDCPRNTTLEGQDEDCLYLNIFRLNNTETLPVMVWIHSDSGAGSGGPKYDGKRVALLGNVVLVTFNYRIGTLGFLSAGGDTPIPGNFGLFDQNMALHWVKNNIGNFGGDVSRITVFGDQDSSKAIGYHVVSNMEDETLFSNIIHQSGVGQMDNMLPLNDLESAKGLSSALGCATDPIEDMVACLRTKTVEEIMANTIDFNPIVVVDGTFLRDQPKALFEESTSRYNYLIGFTSGEGSPDFEHITSTILDEQSFSEFINDEIVAESEFTNPLRVKSVVEYEYKDFENVSADTEQKYQNAAMQMIADKYVIAPSLMLANRTSMGRLLITRTRTFVCNLVSATDDLYPSWMGAPSGSFEKLFWRQFEVVNATPESELADRIVKYWTSFAKNGRPFGMDPDDSWRRYTAEVGEYGEIDAQSEFALIKKFPRPKYATLWNVLIPSIDIDFPCDFPTPPIAPEVNTTNGVIVRGYADTTRDGRNYDVFRGLPYASPPLGDLRFADSVFVGDITSPKGDSVLQATIKKPRCLQTVNGARGGYASEDCLYLDIWRPSGVSLDSRPVLFWICNGGYSVRGPHSQLDDDYSCDIDGQMMALDGNFIFVRVQYRIGVMGFLSTGDSTSYGNAGLSDLWSALQWVAKNIGDFGGSKDKITIAGDGFGGVLAMVFAGMTSTFSAGTVQSVITQSGSLTAPWAYTTSPYDDFIDVAARVGCVAAVVADSTACLRNTDALELITAAGSLQSNFPFAIYGDNTDVAAMTKEDLLDLKIDGKSIRSLREFTATLPILVGVNGGAGYQFTTEAYPEIQLIFGRRPIGPDLIEKMVENDIYLDNLGTKFSEENRKILSEQYVPWGETDSRNEIRRASVHYHTDGGFVVPAYDEITARLSIENSESSFFYIYQERTDKFRARSWLSEGGDLGEEIPVLFEDSNDENIAKLGSNMRYYWANFVNRGSPNVPSSELERWPRYSVEDKDTMVFDSSGARLVAGYKDQAYRIWEEVAAPPSIETTTTTTTTTSTAKTTSCPPSSTKSPVSCTTVTCPDCSAPVMGSGIGLELTPSQADVAIEVLFGIALTFACIIVFVGLYYLRLKKCTESSKNYDQSSVIMNGSFGTTEKKDPPTYNDISSSL